MRTLAHARGRGFTLIQLLVTSALIVVLLAILVPALNGARKRAQLAVCASNLRSTGIAIEHYRLDYNMLPLAYRGANHNADYHGPNKDDVLNQNVIFDNATWRDKKWQGLPGLLSPYLTNLNVFVCPATPSANPVKLFWNGQTSPGTDDTPVATSSYFYFMGDMGNKYTNPGLGNKFYYYPGTPPKPYNFSLPPRDDGKLLNERTVLAQDRFYTDESLVGNGNGNGNGNSFGGNGNGNDNGNGNGNGDNGNGNGKGNGNSKSYAYGNHVSSAEWVPDSYTSTDYTVGVYRSQSLLVFKEINVLRYDSSVNQMQIGDLTPIMVKTPGLGNGKIFYMAYSP